MAARIGEESPPPGQRPATCDLNYVRGRSGSKSLPSKSTQRWDYQKCSRPRKWDMAAVATREAKAARNASDVSGPKQGPVAASGAPCERRAGPGVEGTRSTAAGQAVAPELWSTHWGIWQWLAVACAAQITAHSLLEHTASRAPTNQRVGSAAGAEAGCQVVYRATTRSYQPNSFCMRAIERATRMPVASH